MRSDPTTARFLDTINRLETAERERDQARAEVRRLRSVGESADRGWDADLERLRKMETERDEALERLGPIDPAGNDRIDELESAIGFLRHDLDVAKRERDEAIKQRDYWKRELLSEQADYDKARKERDALRDALQAVQDCVWKAYESTYNNAAAIYHLRAANGLLNEALAGLEEGTDDE